MTSPSPMNREELLQLAALDVFGLLEPYEAELYTRSFHHAPVSVQNEIMQVQSELASDMTLLPADEPDPVLRERVIDAVSRAVEREASRLAPLATIGGRNQSHRDVAGRVGLGLSGQLWRAAAFVLAAMVVVFAYFWSSTDGYSKRVSELALDRSAESQLRALIGDDFEAFLKNPNCTTKVLHPVGGDFPGSAMVFINETSGQAFVLMLGVPELGAPAPGAASTYQLVLRGKDGSEKIVRDFTSNGMIKSLRLDNIPVAQLLASTWVIRSPKGVVMETSA